MTTPTSPPRTDAWRAHPALAQLLGLCPLLAVTTSVTRALGLALATGLVLVCTSAVASLLRRLLARELRVVAHVLIVGAFVTVVDVLMRAYFSALHAQLGIFVPLIATNCVILARTERCALRAGPGRAVADAGAHAAALAVAFVAFGAVRELAGRGTLVAGADALAGGPGAYAGLALFDGGFLLVALTPGAFLALALITAVHDRWASRVATPAREAPAGAPG
jgi:Na+-translocating ferredoxin:NAD+ oxidoreductase subunit E